MSCAEMDGVNPEICSRVASLMIVEAGLRRWQNAFKFASDIRGKIREDYDSSFEYNDK